MNNNRNKLMAVLLTIIVMAVVVCIAMLQDNSTSATTAASTSESADTTQNNVITPIDVQVDNEAELVIVSINVSDLPEGTTATKLPNDEIVELPDTDTVKFTFTVAVVDNVLGEDGTIAITALDNEETPLADCYIQILEATETANKQGWTVTEYVLSGILIALIFMNVYIIFKRKQNKKQKDNS